MNMHVNKCCNSCRQKCEQERSWDGSIIRIFCNRNSARVYCESQRDTGNNRATGTISEWFRPPERHIAKARKHVKHGVPQGTVLGPLLFLIYINDLSLSIDTLASAILFADDTTTIISNSNPEEFQNNINLVVTEITHWFQSNLLTLNFSKTHFMRFITKKQCTRKIQIIGTQFNKL
jgi:hypothetical protein